jgi:hypothetical protein
MKDVSFKMRAILYIHLNSPHYFDPYDGTREMSLLSKDEFDKKFNLPSEKSYERAEKIKKLGWIPIHQFAGQYVGGNFVNIKIIPFYGILHPEAEYFIIFESQIREIMELEVVKKN